MSTATQKYQCEKCALTNNRLARVILELNDEKIIKKTHLINGRYENVYVNPEDLPGMDLILDTAVQLAAERTGLKPEDLKIGFWINLMHKGDITSKHSHDDMDEIVSGVYYVQVPEGSGNFICYDGDNREVISPVEGRFVLFSPSLPHEVTEHHSDVPRISIGFNVGPVDSEFSHFK